MSHHFIEFTSVSFTYPDMTQALKDVTFRIHHGESIGIIGPNGGGKSTLLKLIVGILLPSAGDINVGDTPVTRKTLPSIRRHVGLVFQNPDDQLFMNSVYDDVAFGPRNYGLDDDDVRMRVNKILNELGIGHLADKPPYKLSGGEKREAAIAAVLSMEPDILLLDEPSSDLDPIARRRLLSLLKRFTHTKIITSHDLDLVLEACDRIIVLKDGSLKADGSAESVFSDEARLSGWGLEKPYRLTACPVCGSTPGIAR